MYGLRITGSKGMWSQGKQREDTKAATLVTYTEGSTVYTEPISFL